MRSLLLLLLLLPLPSVAKKHDYFTHFNTEEFWKNIVEEPADAAFAMQPGDTAIVVASNRGTAPGTLRFMSEERDPQDSVRYYLAYTRYGQWHVQRRPTLRSAMAAMLVPQRDWVVYTEGMGKLFTTDLDRGLRLAGQYGVNVLLLDYPSIHSGYHPYAAYRFAYENSRAAYADFVPVLDSMKALRGAGHAGEGRLTLFFHSMGANVLRGIAQHGLLSRYSDKIWVDNIILNAPCVPRRGSAAWIDSIAFARQIWVHYNPSDFVLKWARIAGLGGVLGERPRAPLSSRAAYINFGALSGTNHTNFMNVYLRPPVMREAIEHYEPLMHGRDLDPRVNTNYRVSRYRGIGREILPQL